MFKSYFCYILVIFSAVLSGNCYRIQHLDGNWTVHNLNKSISVPATVPGGIYSDLMESFILEDILFRMNDIEYRWVANETWTYETKFFYNHNFDPNAKYVNLVFDGLDTFSKIYLNGEKIGESSNMFVRYVFNITLLLKEENNLTIIFNSPIRKSQELFDIQEKNYTVPPKCTPKDYNGECHVNFLRKMQASFAWDWGPAFPSVGIWKPVYLEFFSKLVLRDVTVDTMLNGDTWFMNVTVFLESYDSVVNGTIKIEVETDVQIIISFNDINDQVDKNHELSKSFIVKIPENYVELWWPNGYGKQRLYDLKVTYISNDQRESRTKSMRIGFRTVKLIQKRISKGLSFYFEVNNVRMFAKGSNWIPANILPEKGQNQKDITFLLSSAKDAHMNMLRVWGGGVYESDFFYKTADEMGILIWQDFMFACNMYPVNEEFLNSVKSEVIQQVRRLQHHPSIAIWAGNNENEAALRGNWYNTTKNFKQYKKDYVTLYVDTVKDKCVSNDPSRPYLTSSPTNGLESDKEGYVAKNPYDTHFGDLHYYNYVLDGWDKNMYSKPRFSSEYGFQSLPSIETMKAATNLTEDLDLDSTFMQQRQHLENGYEYIENLVSKHLTLPENKTGIEYLNTFSYFSQISQAMSIKAQTEHYRQWRSSIDAEGNGFTMGALYWQLNDVWQAPSWSSIDFEKRWKMLHYFAKKFFHPILVTAKVSEADRMKIYVVSDFKNYIYNTSITLIVYKWDSFTPVYEDVIKTFDTMPGYSSEVAQLYLPRYLAKVGCGTNLTAKFHCFIVLHYRGNNRRDITHSNYVFPAPLKSVKGLTTPNIKINIHPTSNDTLLNKFIINVISDRIALFVWLETPNYNGIFSDNGFLQDTVTKKVIYKISKPISINDLQSDIKITSLKSKEHLA